MTKVDKIMPYVFPFIVMGIFVWYYLVNPIQTRYPLPCPWLLLTGTKCPACGLQRALYAITHGEFLEALKYNYFFIISIPYAVLAIMVTWYNRGHIFDKIEYFVFHRYTLKAFIVLYFSWWIFRNLYGL